MGRGCRAYSEVSDVHTGEVGSMVHWVALGEVGNMAHMVAHPVVRSEVHREMFGACPCVGDAE